MTGPRPLTVEGKVASIEEELRALRARIVGVAATAAATVVDAEPGPAGADGAPGAPGAPGADGADGAPGPANNVISDTEPVVAIPTIWWETSGGMIVSAWLVTP